jgi:hypothetical protein
MQHNLLRTNASLITLPLLSLQQIVSLSQSSRVSPVQLTDGRRGGGGEGVGVEPNHATARTSEPLQIIQYSLGQGKH